jgi:predicted house-cleaning noncanonical NTP pyrophosphatase (MazG superfamily)
MFKLVRDRIPELIQQSGQICNYAEVKNPELFVELLRAKLIEEVNEFLSTGSVEELADISLVVETIAEILNYSEEQFKKVCTDKIEERGKFENKYIIFLPDQLVKSETTNETK